MASEHAFNLKIQKATRLSKKKASIPRHELKLLKLSVNDEALRRSAMCLVRRVAVEEKGWPVGEYINYYADRSHLWCVLHGLDVVGTVLVIEGDPYTFPVRAADAWPLLKKPEGTSAEIPFVVVDPNYRGSSGVSHMLCAACYWHFFENNIDYMELTLDDQLLQFYLWHGMKMIPVPDSEGGGRKRHWGEEGIFPARLFVGSLDDPNSMSATIKSFRPEMWETFEKFRPQ